MHLAHAIVFARDLPLLTAFYSALFQAEPVAATRTADWVEYDLGGSRVGLHAIPAEVAAGIVVSSPPAPREDTPVKLVFAAAAGVADVARIEALGAGVLRRPWGGVDFVDPEGNVFGIVAALSA